MTWSDLHRGGVKILVGGISCCLIPYIHSLMIYDTGPASYSDWYWSTLTVLKIVASPQIVKSDQISVSDTFITNFSLKTSYFAKMLVFFQPGMQTMLECFKEGCCLETSWNSPLMAGLPSTVTVTGMTCISKEKSPPKCSLETLTKSPLSVYLAYRWASQGSQSESVIYYGGRV